MKRLLTILILCITISLNAKELFEISENGISILFELPEYWTETRINVFNCQGNYVFFAALKDGEKIGMSVDIIEQQNINQVIESENLKIQNCYPEYEIKISGTEIQYAVNYDLIMFDVFSHSYDEYLLISYLQIDHSRIVLFKIYSENVNKNFLTYVEDYIEALVSLDFEESS